MFNPIHQWRVARRIRALAQSRGIQPRNLISFVLLYIGAWLLFGIIVGIAL